MPNSDLNPDADEELKAVREQFQRFASQCRLFAPLYRQRTMPSIMAQVQQADQRVSDIGGDMVFNGRIQPQWGLHLIDMHVAIGNLVDIVGQQAAAYMKR
jgi:hypothetical protein